MSVYIQNIIICRGQKVQKKREQILRDVLMYYTINL